MENIKFEKFSKFPKGIMYELLKDSYSFEPRYEKDLGNEWEKADDFFYNNLNIADECGFITTLNDKPIGFICWDPRNNPKYTEIGHNCIIKNYKRKGYGKKQLQESIIRIKEKKPQKIIVTTNEGLIPAQKNYESVGFKFVNYHKNPWNKEYVGRLMDYELTVD